MALIYQPKLRVALDIAGKLLGPSRSSLLWQDLCLCCAHEELSFQTIGVGCGGCAVGGVC